MLGTSVVGKTTITNIVETMFEDWNLILNYYQIPENQYYPARYTDLNGEIEDLTILIFKTGSLAYYDELHGTNYKYRI